MTRTSTLLRVLLLPLPCLALGLAPMARAQAPEAGAVKPAEDHPEARAAIKALDEAFVKAFNAGDAKAVADTFTEGAQILDEDGLVTSGRPAILDRFAAGFEESPGDTITLESKPISFLTDELAQEEGIAVIKSAEGGAKPERIGYVVLYAKADGGWKHAQVRDTPAPVDNHHQRLEELAWMIGDWVSESEDALVSTHVAWAEGENFLIRSFSIQVGDKPVLKGTERIGWDPAAEQFRSWVFDEEGGFGESTWSSDGQGTWIQKASGVRVDGGVAGATRSTKMLSKDRVQVRVSDRTLDGEVLDAETEYVMVRTPPKPR
ncbi:SgcJ/EcaC family oxidoreductase [Isosphaeraceae bacterium EP7]